MRGTTVTVVLVGEDTCDSRWVKYEIERTISEGNGLIQINISQIPDYNKRTSDYCGRMVPLGYKCYAWYKDKVRDKLGDLIEQAARDAGYTY